MFRGETGARSEGELFGALREILQAARERRIPARLSVLDYLGALTLFFCVQEAVTGILLMVYYRPSSLAAFHSVAVIADEVRFGWLIRSLHRWGADVLILLASLHLLRVYFARSYRGARQLNWIVGVFLLLLVVALAFTGILLPWDQYAYWYTDAARATISGVPLLGNLVLGVFWGGWEIGEEVLLRFYALHVGVLPSLVIACLTVHLTLVWYLGTSRTNEVLSTAGAEVKPYFPDFFVDLLISALLATGLLFTLAIAAPPRFSAEADALTPLVGLPSPWYLAPAHRLLGALPGGSAAVTIVVFLVLFLFVPVIDRGPSLSGATKLVHRGVGLLIVVIWVMLGLGSLVR